MTIRRFVVPVTTAADGSATVYSPYLSGYIQSDPVCENQLRGWRRLHHHR